MKDALSCHLGHRRPSEAAAGSLVAALPLRARETACHMATAPRRCPILARGGFLYHVPGGAVQGSCIWRALSLPGQSVCHWPCKGRLSFHPILRDCPLPLFMPVVSEKLGPFVVGLSAKVRPAPGPFFLGPGAFLGSRRSVQSGWSTSCQAGWLCSPDS